MKYVVRLPFRTMFPLLVYIALSLMSFSCCFASDISPNPHRTRLATGHGSMLVVRENGVAWGWGERGRPWSHEPVAIRFLGTAKKTKPDPAFLHNVAAVAVGDQFSYLADENGTLWALGRNDDDRMGVPMGKNGSPMVSPFRVNENVLQVAVAGTTTAIVKRDGTLWMWGSKIPPKKILDNVFRVALSHTHCLALMKDGSLMAWGKNSYGQLGNGSTEASQVPVPVTLPALGNSTIVSITIADGFSLAITEDGNVHQWGRTIGIKDGRMYPPIIPQLPTENVRFVSFGYDKALFIKADDTLWVASGTSAPVKILDNVVEASATSSNTFLALTKDGTFWVWGSCAYWSLGVATEKNWDTPRPLQFADTSVPLTPDVKNLIAAKALLPAVPEPEPYLQIASDGIATEVLLLHKGKLWKSSPYAKSRNFTRVSAKDSADTFIYVNRNRSSYHSVFFEDGILKAKGNNAAGQLGDGTIVDKETAVAVRMPEGITARPDRVSVIATSYYQSGMVMDGVIWLWGTRPLRENTTVLYTISSPRPVVFAAGEVADMALGSGVLLVLTKDGTLWDAGLADIKGPAYVDTPRKVATGVRSFDFDGAYCIALKKDGSLWGWGRNVEQQLSDDVDQDFSKPTRLRWRYGK